MPGYPLIAQSNDYLMARFDKTVLDAKPWCVAQQELGMNEDEALLQPQSSYEEQLLHRLEVTTNPVAADVPASPTHHLSSLQTPAIIPDVVQQDGVVSALTMLPSTPQYTAIA